MTRATASKLGASLVNRKLMREVRSKPGVPVWRKGEGGRPISLNITRAGRDAIGVEEARHPSNEPLREADPPTNESRPLDASGDKDSTRGGATSPRAGTKQALVVGMLSTTKGATLDTLIGATGWLPHTTRAALTGLRKRGFSIERSRKEGSDSIYRIVSAEA